MHLLPKPLRSMFIERISGNITIVPSLSMRVSLQAAMRGQRARARLTDPRVHARTRPTAGRISKHSFRIPPAP